MAIKSVKLETFALRAALLVAAFACLTGVFFFVKWCFANAVASYAVHKDIAEMTTGFAPDDPQTHFASAVLSERTFLPADLPKSLAEYEKATALAPNDFRLWLSLGKARELNDDRNGAELAFRRALALAPNYSQVQWTLGNVLLRQEKTDEAFAQLRSAAENDARFAGQTISIAWQFSDGDIAQVRRHLGESPKINVALASFLAKQKRFDEAIEIWNAVPAEEKSTVFRASGEELFRELLAAKRFREAFEIQAQTGASSAENFTVGKIANGGFETEVKTKDASVFEWQIEDGLQPQIGFDDAQRRGGNRSLVVVFNSATGKEFRALSQTVAVESGKSYKFEAFYKSALRATATLRWEIVDAADGKILAATDTIATGTEWTALQAQFNAPAATQAVAVRLAREICKSGFCPITGKVWFDDLSIGRR